MSDLHVWLGLKNSDDQGANFDLCAELLKNGQVVAVGETEDIRGVISNPTKAKEVTVVFGSIADTAIAVGDVLSLRLSAKVTAQGGPITRSVCACIPMARLAPRVLGRRCRNRSDSGISDSAPQ